MDGETAGSRPQASNAYIALLMYSTVYAGLYQSLALGIARAISVLGAPLPKFSSKTTLGFPNGSVGISLFRVL